MLSGLILFVAIGLAGPVMAEGSPSLGQTNPNKGLFPDSSLADFSGLLSPPAGKYGFLTASPKGHFVWPDGKRARFWGVNISNQSVWIPKERIDQVVRTLARAGCNLVRFEALDSYGGILDAPGSSGSSRLDPRKLDLLDYWTYRLRERGIYYYFDLLDYRQFQTADGVANASQLGRAAKPYAFFDPKLISLQQEYAEELLTHLNPYTHLRYVDDPALVLLEICNEHGLFIKSNKLNSLAQPYETELNNLWNQWLINQYGDRAHLQRAWGQWQGYNVLLNNEDPAKNSVALPLFTPAPPGAPLTTLRAPARLEDGVRFLFDTQQAYFQQMKQYLRSIGLKVPITAVVSSNIVPDVASVAGACDFAAENYYADHPAFRGADWTGHFYYNDDDPLRDDSFYSAAPWTAALKWRHKPVVIREWCTVWPNKYRAVAMPEMLANASLQDFDAVILFGYQTGADADQLSDFATQADPTIWGLFGLCAETFLKRYLRPSPLKVTLRYTPDTLYQWPNSITSLYDLAWTARLDSEFLALPSPKSNVPHSRYSIVRPPEEGEIILYPNPNQPNGLRIAVKKLHQLGDPETIAMAAIGRWLSSTNEIHRNTAVGLMTINAPGCVALSGELPPNQSIHLGCWRFFTSSPIGTIMAASLDGRPLYRSRNFVVKMVSRAANTGQQLVRAPAGSPETYVLSKVGKAPVLTFGKPSKGKTIVKRNGYTLVSLNMINGTWELWVDRDRTYFYCDTPGIEGRVMGKLIQTKDDLIVGGTTMVSSR